MIMPSRPRIAPAPAPAPRFDAVIVGARCAGAATALLLARAGLRVLAIDRAEYGSDTVSTHALMKGGVASLARWGLLGALEAAGTPAVTLTRFHYGDAVVAVPAKNAGGTLYAPRRTVLDRILVDAAREAGAEIRFGATLEALAKDAAGRVTGLGYVDREGRRVAVRAGIVIGADGAGSRVAEQAGAHTLLTRPAGGATLMGYFEGVRCSGFDWHYRPGGMAGALPTNDGQACVFVSAPTARFRGAPLAESFRRRLAATAPAIVEALRRARAVGRLRFFAGREAHLRAAHGAGWALVGDAGYFKDPCTAHGITDAFRDAELLSRAVVADRPGALADYQAIRDALSLPLLSITDRIGRFDWTLEALKGELIALAETMQAEAGVMARLAAASAAPAPAVAGPVATAAPLAEAV